MALAALIGTRLEGKVLEKLPKHTYGRSTRRTRYEVIRSTREAKQQASGYELALASLSPAGWVGRRAKRLNLVIAMREHNKAQKAAAIAGTKTEAQFGKMRMGAGLLATAFSAIGEAIGGTAGKCWRTRKHRSRLCEGRHRGCHPQAGIGSLIKGIAGLFGRAKRKREAAAKEARAAAEQAASRAAEIAAAQKSYWDSVYGTAINAYDRASGAGVAAYDRIFLAALESGIGQEEAVAKATAAQLAASEKILAAEGEKFARIAAFEAALDAIRSAGMRRAQRTRRAVRPLKHDQRGRRRWWR